MQVGRYERRREIVDGAGLCSPGKWPPWERPTQGSAAIRDVREIILGALHGLRNSDCGSPEQIFGRLAAGQLERSPFGEAWLSELRERVSRRLELAGHEVRMRSDDRAQRLEIRLLAAVLRESGDADASGLEQFCRGIRIGVGCKLPRTPAVYKKKCRWRYAEQENPSENTVTDTAAVWRDNYKSAKLHSVEVERQMEEHHEKGWCLRLTEEESRRRYPGLTINSMGAVEKRNDRG